VCVLAENTHIRSVNRLEKYSLFLLFFGGHFCTQKIGSKFREHLFLENAFLARIQGPDKSPII